VLRQPLPTGTQAFQTGPQASLLATLSLRQRDADRQLTPNLTQLLPAAAVSPTPSQASRIPPAAICRDPPDTIAGDFRGLESFPSRTLSSGKNIPAPAPAAAPMSPALHTSSGRSRSPWELNASHWSKIGSSIPDSHHVRCSVFQFGGFRPPIFR